MIHRDPQEVEEYGVEADQEEQNEDNPEHQRPFLEFICYFHICKEKNLILKPSEFIDGVNALRFHVKERCLVQATCSNKHPHLVREVVCSKNGGEVSRLINRHIDLNIPDN